MKERIFIKKAKEDVTMEEFVRRQFGQAKCGAIEVQHTPIVTRIIIHTTTPGLVIGSGGERIKETTEVLKEKLKIENPQIDVQKIENPDLDPHIVAQTIANSLEGGINYKKLGNHYLTRIMNAGAVGCELLFAGKLSGERSRRQIFNAGYLKKCGYPAQTEVLKGFAVANPRLGNIGITVKIMLVRSQEIKDLPAEKAEPVKPVVVAEEKPAETTTAQ
ncbi:MAG: 30S ribosomal protein S3 [Candidatus Aenigmarchaeota archaeon]|nr:30S ribosomal protein S3 [Candidatus Aenigmarchaeota archaeon]